MTENTRKPYRSGEEESAWFFVREAINDEGVFSPDQIAALNAMIDKLEEIIR